MFDKIDFSNVCFADCIIKKYIFEESISSVCYRKSSHDWKVSSVERDSDCFTNSIKIENDAESYCNIDLAFGDNAIEIYRFKHEYCECYYLQGGMEYALSVVHKMNKALNKRMEYYSSWDNIKHGNIIYLCGNERQAISDLAIRKAICDNYNEINYVYAGKYFNKYFVSCGNMAPSYFMCTLSIDEQGNCKLLKLACENYEEQECEILQLASEITKKIKEAWKECGLDD